MSRVAECPFCGEESYLDILEVWGRDFMLDTCCEDSHAAWLDDLNDPEFRELALQEVGAALDGYVPCRQVFTEDGRFQIDAGLEVRELGRKDAQAFVREHHRHNPPPPGDRFRFGCYNMGELVAVAIVGRPVARAIDHSKVVEVNRLCVNHGLNAALTWKACSMLYRAAVDEAGRRGFAKVITYTLESEKGMSLRYARFKPVARTRGGSWDTPARRRTDKAPTCPKVRWERTTRAQQQEVVA